MCKDRGLKVSGSKAEVVIRLMENDESQEPQTTSIPQQNIQLNQQQMYGSQQPTQILSQIILLMLYKLLDLESSVMGFSE